MSVQHGDKRGPLFHDHKEKYKIRVEGGQFSSEYSKLESELLRGLKFNYESDGHWLEKSSLNFETTTCHDISVSFQEFLSASKFRENQ